MRGVWRRIQGVAVLAGVTVGGLCVAMAATQAASPNLSRSYDSDQSIPNGSLVSLSANDDQKVQAANTSNAGRLLGIAVNGNDSLLAIEPQPSKIQVATSGSAIALVSTVNGSIRVGDQIGPSPFNGIGMKAPVGSRVVGLAQTAFGTESAEGVKREVTDKGGKKSAVNLGYVRVAIALGTNTTAKQDNLNSLQKAVRSITGRTVSTLRIVASLVVLLLTFIILVTLIYSSIYGGIVSIGRNPLAKYTVFRALGSVVGLAIGVVIVAGILIFLLLW